MELVQKIQKQYSHKNVITPKGYRAGGMHCGLKYKRSDLAIIYSEVPAHVAGVFTTNAIQAAPLHVTKEVVYETKKMQAIVVNSGNANACTGKQGLENAYKMQQATAEKLGIDSNLVGVASTGIIGEQMNMGPVLKGINQLYIGTSSENAIQVSQAILTTDTVTKTTSYILDIDGKEVTISGVAKGSGMIAPNMATMLAFITTDAAVTSEALQQALSSITDQTFNSITVDGDTSTNDTVLVMANGMAENDMLTDEHPDWDLFVEGVRAVSEDLAKMIAKDGEGATKLVEVNVNNGMCEETSRIIAKKVVGSPLVKTAMYGNDGNWGRIIAAIGYSGVPIDPNKISIKIGPFDVLSMGEPVPFEDAAVTHYLKKSEVVIDIDLGIGDASGTAWGCDLSYDYVQINASYRT